jgi:hypothetical protein
MYIGGLKAKENNKNLLSEITQPSCQLPASRMASSSSKINFHLDLEGYYCNTIKDDF